MSFDQTRAELHVGYRNGRTSGYKMRGTGLGTPGLINGRPATEDEAAAQERAWARSREATAEQLRVVPYQSTMRADMWAAIDKAWAAVTT